MHDEHLNSKKKQRDVDRQAAFDAEPQLIQSRSPLLDRGIVLVSLAAAIALGATSMSDIALLAHPVLGDALSGPTVRRALDLAGTAAVLDRIARAARGPARTHGS